MTLRALLAPLVVLSLWLGVSPAARADLMWPPRVSAAEFGRTLKAELAKVYGVPADAITLEGLPAQGPLPLPVPAGDGETLRLRDQALRTLAGRTSLPLDILEGGKPKRMLALPIRVVVMTDVVVAAERIGRGVSLGATQLHIERRPFHTVQRGTFTKVDDAIGRTALVDINAGSVVTGYLVRGAATSGGTAVAAAGGGVRVGSEVTVRLSSDGLSLVGKGRVLDSGDVGAEVRVRLLNFANSKVIKARVLNAQEVRVNVEGTP